jgi:hypothetical protein
MNVPPLRLVVIGALVVLAIFGAVRALSGKKDNTSDAIVNSITTPIGQAARAEASANVTSAISAVQIYFAEHDTYAGISRAALLAVDAGLSPTVQVFATASGYCLMASVRDISVRNVGPSNGVEDGAC